MGPKSHDSNKVEALPRWFAFIFFSAYLLSSEQVPLPMPGATCNGGASAVLLEKSHFLIHVQEWTMASLLPQCILSLIDTNRERE